MKRTITMLLIAIASAATINAQTSGKKQNNTPVNVIKELNFVINMYGEGSHLTYSVNRNPDTGVTESSEKVVHFKGSKNGAVLFAISKAFTTDEPMSYQFMHILPESNELFNLDFVTKTTSATSNRMIRIRKNKNHEMWLMCTKNPTNPQLRDAYAIVWENIIGKDSIERRRVHALITPPGHIHKYS